MDHLWRGSPFPRQLLDGDAPEIGDVLALLRDVDVSIAGKLVGLLTNLAPTLSVALAGNHHGTAARFAQLATCQCEIDAGQAGIHTMGAVLNTFAMHDKGGCGATVEACGSHDSLSRHTGEPFGLLGGKWLNRRTHLLPAVGAFFEIHLVHQAVDDNLAKHRIDHGFVRTEADRQPQIGRAREGRLARIDDYQVRSLVASAPDPLHDDGKTFRYIHADCEHAIGERDIGHGQGRAVDAKGPGICDGGRRHAQAAIVVYISRTQSHAGKLPHHIAFLVGHGGTTVNGDGIVAMLRLDLFPPAHDVVHRLIPGGTLQLPGLAAAANHGVP